MMEINNNPPWRKQKLINPVLMILYIVSFCFITSKAQNSYSEIAKNLLDTLDFSVEPCEDFYKFACGKFITTTVLPDEKQYVDVYSLVEDKIDGQLENALEEELKPNDAKHVKMIKTFYRNCINESAINKNGLQSAQAILKNLGGWPILEGDSWKAENFNWQQLVYKFKNEGFPKINFFASGVMTDPNNTSKRVLYIDHPFIDLTPENLEVNYNFMVDIAVIFGADKKRAKLELKRSFELEMSLFNISTANEERILNDRMTLKQLQTKYPIISWKEYFNDLLRPKNEIEENDQVLVKDPNFFNEFGKIIEKFAKREQANYIMWKVVKDMIRYYTISDDIRTILFEITGQKKRAPRMKECISLVNNNFGSNIDSIYVNKYFNKDSIKDVEEIFNNIKQEFGNMIKTLTWVDDETKESLLEKLRTIKSVIGYDDKFLDDKKIDEFYRNLEITPGDHLKSMLNLTLFLDNYLLGLWKLEVPENEFKWTTLVSPVEVNAFYLPNYDIIYVPGGILQESFYFKGRPTSMNYGALGFILGHEITHFFDNNMNKIEGKNPLGKKQQETLKKYRSNVECFIQQYGNYAVEDIGLNLNGDKTQRENIADNGGIKIAYLAYQEWVKRNGPEIMLPDLEFTQSQLFWISAAQSCCAKYTTEYLENFILDREYSPEEFQIFGSFSNRPEFAKDFNCHNNSKMIAKNVCSVL